MHYLWTVENSSSHTGWLDAGIVWIKKWYMVDAPSVKAFKGIR